MATKISAKINLGFASMLLLILILGGYSYYSLKLTKSNLENIKLSTQRIVLEQKIENKLKTTISGMNGFISYQDEKFYIQVEDNFKNLLELENILFKMSESEHKADVQLLISLSNEYVNITTNDWLPIIKLYLLESQSGNMEQAKLYFKQINNINDNLTPLENKIFVIANDLVSSDEETLNSKLLSSGEAADKIIMLSILVTAIAAFVGIILSIFLTIMIRKPIFDIVSGANKFAEGDFREVIKAKSSDEIGELAAALNKMQVNFKGVIKNLSFASGELSNSARQLAFQAQNTSAGVSETASAFSEIAAAAQNMSETVLDVSQKASKASEYAGQGYRSIEMVTSQMQQIAESAQKANTTNVALQSVINRIGQFINVITSIADQTNLLALNATIEAARAGDAGKGFSVVAEEVRKLAEQSALSAKDIKQMIDEIQEHSHKTMEAMASGAQKVEEGNQVVEKVGQHFADIIKIVQGLSSQIQDAANFAQHVTANVQNVAETAEEQTAAMDEVNTTTKKLDSMAQDLKTLVQKFKI